MQALQNDLKFAEQKGKQIIENYSLHRQWAQQITRNMRSDTTLLNPKHPKKAGKEYDRLTFDQSIQSIELLTSPSYNLAEFPNQSSSLPVLTPKQEELSKILIQQQKDLHYVSTGRIESIKSKFNLKNDFLCRKLLDYIKNYNQELADLIQSSNTNFQNMRSKQNKSTVFNQTHSGQNQSRNAFQQLKSQTVIGSAATPQPGSQLFPSKTKETLNQLKNPSQIFLTTFGGQTSANSLNLSKPADIYNKSIQLQRLTVKSHLSNQIIQILALIETQNQDIVLQKSMLAILQQWLQTNDKQLMPEYDDPVFGFNRSSIASFEYDTVGNASVETISQDIQSQLYQKTALQKLKTSRTPSVQLNKNTLPNIFQIQNVDYSQKLQDSETLHMKYLKKNGQALYKRPVSLIQNQNNKFEQPKVKSRFGSKMGFGSVPQTPIKDDRSKKQNRLKRLLTDRAVSFGEDSQMTQKLIDDLAAKIPRKLQKKLSKVLMMSSARQSREINKDNSESSSFKSEEFMTPSPQKLIQNLSSKDKDPSIGPALQRMRVRRFESSSEGSSYSDYQDQDQDQEQDQEQKIEVISETYSQDDNSYDEDLNNLLTKLNVPVLLKKKTSERNLIEYDNAGSTMTKSPSRIQGMLDPVIEIDEVSDNNSIQRVDSQGTKRDVKRKAPERKVPDRTFQNAPKEFDMTYDAPYEHRWRKITKVSERPKKRQDQVDYLNTQRKYIYDRFPLDDALFEQYQDQGDVFREFETVQAAAKNKEFWNIENNLQDQSKQAIIQLQKIPKPYDFFKMDVVAYNLSIQHDKAKGKDKGSTKKGQPPAKGEAGKGKKAKGKDKEKEEKEAKDAQEKAETLIAAAGGIQAGPTSVNLKSLGSQQKQMGQALEQFVQEAGNRADPIFTRGAEIEISTRQDVELLKAHLAQIKLHIPTKTLESAIIMPKDIDGSGGYGYPKLSDLLQHNPFPPDKKEKKTKKGDKDGPRKKRKNKEDDVEELPVLELNAKKEYRVYEFGNYPLLRNGKPKGGQYRLRLPADADWNPKQAEKAKVPDDDVLKTLSKSKTKKIK